MLNSIWRRRPKAGFMFGACIISLAVAACSGPVYADDPQRPNIVLIMTDNHGAWTLGCYGNPEIRTPNIDRLSREGIQFNHAYANNAVCSPTRASLLPASCPRNMACTALSVVPR